MTFDCQIFFIFWRGQYECITFEVLARSEFRDHVALGPPLKEIGILL